MPNRQNHQPWLTQPSTTASSPQPSGQQPQHKQKERPGITRFRTAHSFPGGEAIAAAPCMPLITACRALVHSVGIDPRASGCGNSSAALSHSLVCPFANLPHGQPSPAGRAGISYTPSAILAGKLLGIEPRTYHHHSADPLRRNDLHCSSGARPVVANRALASSRNRPMALGSARVFGPIIWTPSTTYGSPPCLRKARTGTAILPKGRA